MLLMRFEAAPKSDKMQAVNAIDGEKREDEIVENNDHRERWQIAALVILLFALSASAPFLYETPHAKEFLLAYLGATIVWLALVARKALPGKRLIIVVAIALRLVMWRSDLGLSTDVYRYLWDASVTWSGSNPYRFSPADAPAGIPRPAWFDKINHPEVRSIYPPHAQIVFLVSAGALMPWRIALLASDLLLIALLRRHGSHRIALAYAFCPLVIIEGHWNAHLEPLVALALFAAIAMLPRREGLSAALVALASGLKLTPLVTVPVISSAATRRLRFSLVFVAALCAPVFLFLPSPIMPGMREFARRWIFNAPLFEVVLKGVESLALDSRMKQAWTGVKDYLNAEGVSEIIYAHLYPDFLARAICALLLLVVLLVIAKSSRTVTAKSAHSMGALFLLSPVVHPWYWIAGLPLFLRARTWLWAGAAILSPVSYTLYASGARSSPLTVVVCWLVPALVAAAVQVRAVRRSREEPAARAQT